MIQLLDAKKQLPIGYLTIKDNGTCSYFSLSKKHFKDALSKNIENEIKEIYGLDFACSLYWLRNVNSDSDIKDDDFVIIPKSNGTNLNDIGIINYINVVLKGKPQIEELNQAEVYTIINGNLEIHTLGDLLPVIAKKKGIILKEVDPRFRVYPVYKYKNYSRRSGVYAYAYNPQKTVIYVYFTGDKQAWYRYYYGDGANVKRMIQHAKSGYGLNRYINKNLPPYYWKGKFSQPLPWGK